MKCQLDKCEFYKKKGFVISDKGIETNPNKVLAIANYPQPRTLKDLRAFIGLAGYDKRFIGDFANLAKPHSSLLRGEDGRVSKNDSKKKIINMNQDAIEAFNKIKNSLVSDEVILQFPYFNK